jgi:hypothetical protein
MRSLMKGWGSALGESFESRNLPAPPEGHERSPGRDGSRGEFELLGADTRAPRSGEGRPRRLRRQAERDGLVDPLHHLLQGLTVRLASPAEPPDRGRIASVRVPS